MSDGGKGSKPRPFSVSQEQFSKNWDTIFSKKVEPEKGEQRITPEGILEEYREGYWFPLENRS